MRIALFNGSPRVTTAAAVAALAAHLFAAAAAAQQTATPLDFRNAPLTAVVQAVADSTGQRFIVDPSIQAPLTIMAPGPLSAESMWQAFNSLLEVYGLEARRVGRDLRIAATQPNATTSAVAARAPARVVASSILSVKGQCSPDNIATEPVLANGVQRGLRVSAGKDAVEFDRLGLDQGDVLLRVNGTALNDPANSKQVLDTALSGAVDVTVELERGGRVQELILYTARL